jgi:hypothetical protein
MATRIQQLSRPICCTTRYEQSAKHAARVSNHKARNYSANSASATSSKSPKKSSCAV